jgi:uncharacterized membrane protein
VAIAVDGVALKAVADEWASSQNASLFQAAYVLMEIGLSLFAMLIFLMFGVMFILYGLAVALSDIYPKWLGWLALVLGIAGAVIGLVQAYEGPSDTLTNVIFPIVSILLTVWVLIIGAFMWKKTSAA